MKRKLQRFLDPVWVPPPETASYDFCEDYIYEWTLCYAIGVMQINPETITDAPAGKLVRVTRKGEIVTHLTVTVDHHTFDCHNRMVQKCYS